MGLRNLFSKGPRRRTFAERALLHEDKASDEMLDRWVRRDVCSRSVHGDGAWAVLLQLYLHWCWSMPLAVHELGEATGLSAAQIDGELANLQAKELARLWPDQYRPNLTWCELTPRGCDLTNDYFSARTAFSDASPSEYEVLFSQMRDRIAQAPRGIYAAPLHERVAQLQTRLASGHGAESTRQRGAGLRP